MYYRQDGRRFVKESTNVSSLLIGSKRDSRLLRWCMCGSVAFALLSLFLGAQKPSQKPKVNPLAPRTERMSPGSEPAHLGAHELTETDLQAFFDGMMPLQIAREDIAGAVITVVKDGKPFFAKGYGYSNVEKRIPVSPETTLFRPGSISKLFNWTGIMQQVELGKLDLDRDVNDYLDFKIPQTYSKPITLRNIMTHTPGFEETEEELFVANASDLKPLDGYVKAHLPVRIFPPGSSSLTGADMQHFMIAHLQDGRYAGTQILRPETAQLMHSRQFSNLPDLNGMALGFYEETRNGHRILGHAGDTEYFHSDLHLIPDAGIGFFISYNSAGKGEIRAREAVWHAFLDRYFPYDPPPLPVQATAAADARLVSGRYIASARSQTI